MVAREREDFMSEWAPCHLCGAERENLCACCNPVCSDYVAPAPKQPTPEERTKRERTEAVEELDRAIGRCCTSGIFREHEIKLEIETAKTLRSHIDDLDTADQQCTLAEKAYEQCDAKLKDALVEIENLRRWKQEMLTLERWWKDVDAAVRLRSDVLLGTHVSMAALRLIAERDAVFAIGLLQRTAVKELVELIDCGNGPKAHQVAMSLLEMDVTPLEQETLVKTDLLREILDTLHYTMPHLAVGGDVRPKIRPLIAAIEKLIPSENKPSAQQNHA
jgi:hypothetical protein